MFLELDEQNLDQRGLNSPENTSSLKEHEAAAQRREMKEQSVPSGPSRGRVVHLGQPRNCAACYLKERIWRRQRSSPFTYDFRWKRRDTIFPSEPRIEKRRRKKERWRGAREEGRKDLKKRGKGNPYLPPSLLSIPSSESLNLPRALTYRNGVYTHTHTHASSWRIHGGVILPVESNFSCDNNLPVGQRSLMRITAPRPAQPE